MREKQASPFPPPPPDTPPGFYYFHWNTGKYIPAPAVGGMADNASYSKKLWVDSQLEEKERQREEREECRYCVEPGPGPLCDPCWGVLLGIPLPHPQVKHPTFEQHPFSPPIVVSKVDQTWLKDLLLMGVKILAGVCDGARTKDDKGFDGADASFGHSVARQTFISPKQLPICVKLVLKYHRQLPGDIVEAAKEWKKERG